MIATLCRIYSKEHPNQIGSLDPWLKSLVNYWARIAVSFKRQDRGFNNLADNYHFIRQNGLRFTCVLGLNCAFIVYVNFNIWLTGHAKFPGLKRNGPLFCRYRNYLDAKMTIFQSLEKIFFLLYPKCNSTCQLRTFLMVLFKNILIAEWKMKIMNG